MTRDEAIGLAARQAMMLCQHYDECIARGELTATDAANGSLATVATSELEGAANVLRNISRLEQLADTPATQEVLLRGGMAQLVYAAALLLSAAGMMPGLERVVMPPQHDLH